MTDADSRDTCAPQTQMTLSEAEVIKLIEEAAQQYEEYARLAGLADFCAPAEVLVPKYAWDNPIGLVVTEPMNAKLV